MPRQEKYLLPVGSADFKRITLLGDIYKTANMQFMLEKGLRAGMRVADIGCGPGNVALWMAEQVGPSGHVTAIDRSTAQLAFLKKRIAKENISQMTPQNADVYDLSKFYNQFDFIFSRFLLLHLKDPQKAIIEMVKALKPGGHLITADIDSSTWYSYPSSKTLQTDIRLLSRSLKKYGADLKVAPKVPALFKKTGLTHTDVDCFQPVLDKQSRHILLYKTQAWSTAYVDNKLISKKAVTQLIEDMKQLVTDDSRLFLGARMLQVYGQKL